jgi:hypothetical protein
MRASSGRPTHAEQNNDKNCVVDNFPLKLMPHALTRSTRIVMHSRSGGRLKRLILSTGSVEIAYRRPGDVRDWCQGDPYVM